MGLRAAAALERTLCGRGFARRVLPMMATDTSFGSRRVTLGVKRGRHAASSPLPVSVVAIIAATGVLVVTPRTQQVASATPVQRGRTGCTGLGQALILVPTAVRLLNRRVLTARETFTLVTVLTVAEYLVWVCYSPAAFTFVDELEHCRSTVDVLQTGKLSTVNHLLPISPQYPGLEEVTSALASITGLSVFTSGLIVAGVAHLMFVYVLFLLFREISGSYRIAGVAVLCYASNSHFALLRLDVHLSDTRFALPRAHIAGGLEADLTAKQSGQRAGWLILAVLAIVATVVTHHVTSYVLVAIAARRCSAALITRNWRTASWAAILALLSTVAVMAGCCSPPLRHGPICSRLPTARFRVSGAFSRGMPAGRQHRAVPSATG